MTNITANRLRVANLALILLILACGRAMTQDVPVNKSNWLKPQTNITAFQNVNLVTTTAVISRQGTPVSPLLSSPRNLDDVVYNGIVDGKPLKLALADFLDRSYTDSFLVVHNGRVVYERCFNGLSPYKRHMMMMMSVKWQHDRLRRRQCGSQGLCRQGNRIGRSETTSRPSRLCRIPHSRRRGGSYDEALPPLDEVLTVEEAVTGLGPTYATAAELEADELCYMSAADLVPLFKSRKVSPVDLLKAQVARYEKVNVMVNCVT